MIKELILNTKEFWFYFVCNRSRFSFSHCNILSTSFFSQICKSTFLYMESKVKRSWHVLLELSLKPLCQVWALCCQSIAKWPYEIGTQIIFVLSCPPVKLLKRETPAVKQHKTYKCKLLCQNKQKFSQAPTSVAHIFQA